MDNPATDITTSSDLLEPLVEGGDVLANAEEAAASPDGDNAWRDTFYEKETDIVAVFDMDTEAIKLHQRQTAVKLIPLTLIFSLLFVFDDEGPGLDSFLSVFFFLMALFGFWAIVLACRQSRAASAGGIHLAITSSSVRYDQEKPLLSTEISLQSINSCTVIQQEIKPYHWFGAPKTLNVVTLQIAGARMPKTFVGLKDASNFSHLVMSLKTTNNNYRAETDDPSLIV